MRETVETWLKKSVKKLKDAEIASAQLDARINLAHVLGVERTFCTQIHKKKSFRKLWFFTLITF